MAEKSCKIVLITSCKGGVGKSTVTANLALALALCGKRTLALDCDFSNRTLDLLFGCEDAVLYDLLDVMDKRVELSDAVLTDRRSSDLLFLPAPFLHEQEEDETGKGGEEDVPFAAAFGALLDSAVQTLACDFILIDTPGSAHGLLSLCAKRAEMALIVVSHHPAAIRGAEKTGMLLDSRGIPVQKLVVNRFDAAAVMGGYRPGINAMIDMTRTPILGVIPEDHALELGQESGKLYPESAARNTTAAFSNLAARLCGGSVPLFTDFHRVSRRKLVEY